MCTPTPGAKPPSSTSQDVSRRSVHAMVLTDASSYSDHVLDALRSASCPDQASKPNASSTEWPDHTLMVWLRPTAGRRGTQRDVAALHKCSPCREVEGEVIGFRVLLGCTGYSFRLPAPLLHPWHGGGGGEVLGSGVHGMQHELYALQHCSPCREVEEGK